MVRIAILNQPMTIDGRQRVEGEVVLVDENFDDSKLRKVIKGKALWHSKISIKPISK